MTKITSFDKNSLIVLSTALDEALLAVQEKTGVKVLTGGIRFTQTNCTVKLECSVVGADGAALSREAEAFKRYAADYGLTPEHLNREFKDPYTGKVWKLAGFNANARKNPFIIHDSRGATFTAPAGLVQRGFDIDPVSLKPRTPDAK